LRFIACLSFVLCPDVGFILTLVHDQRSAFDGSVLDAPHIDSRTLGSTESIDVQSDVSSICTPYGASANLMKLSCFFFDCPRKDLARATSTSSCSCPSSAAMLSHALYLLNSCSALCFPTRRNSFHSQGYRVSLVWQNGAGSVLGTPIRPSLIQDLSRAVDGLC
jgi:hypothetical protein